MPKISARTIELHRAETIEKLFDAFGELVMERGYADLSLADVASHAGIARTAIYNYFPDREALFFAWTDREVANTLKIVERDLASVASYAEKLRVFVHSQLTQFVARHLPPGKEAMQFLGPGNHDRFTHHIEPMETLLRDVLQQGMAVGEFEAADPEGTVPLVMACIGAERVPLASRRHDVDEATERVTSFLLRALVPVAHVPARAKRRPAKP